MTSARGAWHNVDKGILLSLQGEASRAVGAHRLNVASSRSHALLSLVVDVPATASSSPTTARVLIPCNSSLLSGCAVMAAYLDTYACLLAPIPLLCLLDVPKITSLHVIMLEVFSA